ncbi:extracellular solute-binding protein [Sulfolobus sp. E5-1-F]|uniref:extracellular solute-binding protein n=1 Tax=Sulfolobaceae TaxID=118883 RepID=UPI00129749B4|nr:MULTISPECIES: extracellular solute-binding protein [unclassified Sulfolobus]QGA54295.1 extracellular solute-binding protein [Sulfolobus sp. E5-1-F]QGA69349.1 extracellular solute-binding protein [Sulfolobus sp. E11-6]
MTLNKGLTRVQAVVIIVVVIIAVIAGMVGYYLSNHPSKSITTSSTTTSSSITTSSSLSSTTTSPSTTSTSSQGVTVFVAGAYLAILNYLAGQFQNATGIPVHVVGSGSFALASQIASQTPVPANVLIPVAYIQAVELTGSRNPGWAIAFLSDQMAIVYSNYTTKSPYWSQLYSNYTMAMETNDTKYWYNFFYLLTTKFSLGIANPNTDPEGLYAYLILQMAGYLYSNHNISYFVNLVKANPNVKVAPSTANYVAPLKAGTLDFTFSYVSYAVSQGLEYLKLPPWLSFGYYPNETNWYSQFAYNISVNGQTLTIHGNPVYLYITVPLNASNTQVAYQFISFILSHESELTKFNVIPIQPALLFNETSNIPQSIMNLLNSGELKYAGNFSEV